MNTHKCTWFSDIAFLALGLTLIFGIFLGNRPLSAPDEARYSEIPREMIVSSDYLTPHLNGVKYFEKPALFYWLQAASLKTFGLNEWGARLPNAFMALLGCLFCYTAGRLLFNRRTGLFASGILGTSLLYFAMAHMVTLDMSVSVLLAGSLFSFLIGAQQPDKSFNYLWFYAFYIFAALALFTKGLIGIVIPGIVIGSWILLTQQWSLLKKVYLPTGIILFLLVAAPWHLLVQAKNPEFLYFYFIDQHFLRYLTMEANRYQPIWFLFSVVIIGLLPWTAFLIQAIRHHLLHNWQARFSQKNNWFLLLWVGLVFIFFSFSNSKLIPYILPIFPPLALILGHYFADHWQNNSKTIGLKIGFIATPLTITSLLTAGFIALNLSSRHYTVADPATAKQLFWLATTIWLPGSIIATILYFRQKLTASIILMALSSTIVFIFLVKFIPAFDSRSIKPLAIQLKPLLNKNTEVATYTHYYQDLPFYLQRTVSIVDWRNELTFGLAHQPQAKQWMIDQTIFWQRWYSQKQMYMITSQKTYQELLKQKKKNIYLIAQTPDSVLISNH